MKPPSLGPFPPYPSRSSEDYAPPLIFPTGPGSSALRNAPPKLEGDPTRPTTETPGLRDSRASGLKPPLTSGGWSSAQLPASPGDCSGLSGLRLGPCTRWFCGGVRSLGCGGAGGGRAGRAPTPAGARGSAEPGERGGSAGIRLPSATAEPVVRRANTIREPSLKSSAGSAPSDDRWAEPSG